MPPIIYTLEQYQAISDAIAQGVTKVKYSDKEVEYRSLEEMLRIQSMMYNQLFPQNKKKNRIFPSFYKGTCNKRR